MSTRGQSDDERREGEADKDELGLDEQERKQAEERANPTALVVHEIIRAEGQGELERPASSLLLSGLAAGLGMGFSLVAEGVLRAHLPDAPWRPLVAKLGYSAGFLFAVLGRQQLYTETPLTAVIPVLHDKKASSALAMLRLWALVFASNLLGTYLFAFVAAHTGVMGAWAREPFLAIGHEAIAPGPGDIFLRGIFAGWLIALMVWLLPAARNNAVAIIVGLTWLIGVGGFSHCIAGSVETMYLATLGQIPWRDYFLGFLLPATVGNTLGGAALVAVLNHGQVAAERKEAQQA